MDGGKGKEEHLEDLLVQYPGLLNYGAYVPDAKPEVLIIARQPKTKHGKRPDLLGIHEKGDLVVIEVKRDRRDELGRLETMEFQAIRYAAASRKLTWDGVVEEFANYLAQQEHKSNSQKPPDEENAQWRKLAIDKLCKHLGGDEAVTVQVLPSLIQPKKKQRIYLVAASFGDESLSACAWLREHDIPISCFMLRPYKVSGEIVFQRERLIPPPELDDYMADSMAESRGALETESSNVGGSKAPPNKPTKLTWSDDIANSVSVTSWKSLAEQVVRRALELGLKEEELPMSWSKGESELQGKPSVVHLKPYGLDVDLHGSADQIQTWITKIIKRINAMGNGVSLEVETQNGTTWSPGP